jgi:hypothetical protein
MILLPHRTIARIPKGDFLLPPWGILYVWNCSGSKYEIPAILMDEMAIPHKSLQRFIQLSRRDIPHDSNDRSVDVGREKGDGAKVRAVCGGRPGTRASEKGIEMD